MRTALAVQVAVGYYEMPEKTCEEFQQDEEGGRWFRTGDIGCMMQVTTVRCKVATVYSCRRMELFILLTGRRTW